MSQSPFHFAFFVRDLESTRDFYSGVLGCREGRSSDLPRSCCKPATPAVARPVEMPRLER